MKVRFARNLERSRASVILEALGTVGFFARGIIFFIFFLLLDLDLRYWGRNPIDGFFFSFVFFSSCFSLVHIHQNPLLISPPRVTYTIKKM